VQKSTDDLVRGHSLSLMPRDDLAESMQKPVWGPPSAEAVINRMLVLPAMIATAACLLATARAVPAQPLVRIVGAVQWVSSTWMAMMSDHGGSIMIDLRRPTSRRIGASNRRLGHRRRYAGG
jgi:hypothetical protein